MSLKRKTLGGVFWTFSQQVSVQAINFIVQIILARILLPEAFGLIALLQVFLAVGKALLDGGMTSSLIRTKDADQSDFSTVFYMNLVISVLIYLLLFCVAPSIATFYHQPPLSLIVRVYTLAFVMQALIAVQTTILTKEMNFKLQMLMQLPSVIVGGLVGVILAETGYGVWSLVWMYLVRTFLFMILHWFYADWRPKLIFSTEKFKLHFSFGYKLTFSSLVTSIYTNIYPLIIGRFFSVTELGFFQQANNLSIFPVANISTALYKVVYPLFSSLNHDNIKLKEVYKKINVVVFYICTPLMMLLAINARDIFILVLTKKWLPAVSFFQALCIAYIFYPFSQYSMGLMPAKGRSDLHLKAELVKKGVSTLVIIILLIIFKNIWSIIAAASFSIVFQALINSWYGGSLIGYSIKHQFKPILSILLIGASCLIITVVFFDIFFLGTSYILLVNIFLKSSLFLLLYFFASKIFKIVALKDIQLIFRGRRIK